ncbi:hypothetical protein [Micromonospora sp. NPDC002575]|uniref:hypothetical protein n=1 Tax=Micromonospora sp. NPDC002575 TaxID=3364222 RepID=UPI0036C4CFDE
MAVETTELRAGPTVRVAETIRAVSADLGPSWAATAAAVDRAAANFLDTVSDRLPGRLPERDHTVVFATLGRLAAGGTGLAPLRALVEQLAAAPDGRRVTLVAGARTPADLYDRATLAELEAAHEWLTVVPAYSHDPAAGPAERGDALTVALRHLSGDQEVHLCGPPPMVAGARLRLLAAGVPADRIHLPDTFDRWRPAADAPAAGLP